MSAVLEKLDSADVILQQWDALQLEILKPAALGPRELAVIACARHSPRSYGYLNDLPIKVADFKPEVAAALMDWALKSPPPLKFGDEKRPHHCKIVIDGTGQIRDESNYGTNRAGDPFLNENVRAFARDVEKINQLIFGLGLRVSECDVGEFGRPKVNYLHIDGGGLRPAYISRLNDLPAEAIKGQPLLHAPKDIRRLVERASVIDDTKDRDNAIRDLRARKVLEPLDLGGVYLMMCEKPVGTWHISADVPEAGARSAFFRAYGATLNGLSA